MYDFLKTLIILMAVVFLINIIELETSYGQDYTIDIHDSEKAKKIVLKDQSLVIEEYVTGLNWPTNFDFIGNDLFITEKNSGNIIFIRDGKIVDESILKIDVSDGKEEGLLGILARDTTIYLHYTTRNLEDDTTSNWFYKYYWNGERFTEPKLLKQIHGGTEAHNAGPMIINSDGIVYGTLGDLNNRNGKLQNQLVGDEDYTSSIFELENNESYFAIGIRNSFGLAIDPVTGNMWISENGPDRMDEINLVSPGFNSGWTSIMGPATEKQIQELPNNGFVYSNPEFSWEKPVSPTAITFVKSEQFVKYHNSLLVGDFNTGTLYEFKLNNDRTGLVFENSELKDLVLNESDFANEIVLGTGFLGITDIQEGPDGMLYILSIGDGILYRISPLENLEISDNRCDLQIKTGANLSRCNLSGMNLEGIDLSNSDLSFTNIQNTNLKNINLHGATLSGADLRGAIISGADLSNTDFSMSTLNKIKFDNVNFENANLRSANFGNTEISNTNFSFSDLDHVNFKNAKIINSKFNNVNLNRGNLEGINLEKIEMKNSFLDHVVVSNAELNDVNFSKSVIWVTDFSSSNLNKIKFLDSDIYDTKFIETTLNRSDFDGSKIGNSFFDKADLSESSFLDVYPFETSFENVIISKSTKINSCLEHDMPSRIINKILREIRDNEMNFFNFLEDPLVKLCSKIN